MKLSKNINKIWLGYFVTKIFYMFFALFFYQKFIYNPTRGIGDLDLYLKGQMNDGLYLILTDPTILLEFIGKYLNMFLGPILSNIPFLILSFYGVFYSVSKLQLSNSELLWVLFLLSFPTFGVYSSVIGKEAMCVFYFGIISGYLFDLINKNRIKPKLIELLALYLLSITTPSFFIGIGSVFLFVIISNKFHLKGYGKLFLLASHILLAIFLFYIFRDILNDMSFDIDKYFRKNAGSTRENIFINNYDIFWKAPYGMFVAFWGPTFFEITQKPIQSIAFIESLIIFIFFLFFIMRFLAKALKTSHFNIYVFALTFMLVFWFLFAHYPSGIMNPGSALRYRVRFYGFLVVFLFFLYSKYIKKN